MMSSLLLSVLLAALLFETVSPGLLAGLCGGIFLLLTVLRRKNRHSPSPWMQMDVLAQSSRLSGWNPGLKVCASFAFLLLCVGADSLYLAAFLTVVMTVLNLTTSRISMGDYLALLWGPVAFLSLSGLVLLVEVSSAPQGYLDIPLFAVCLSITPATQQAALLVISKAVGALCCLYALGLSTTMYEITSFLRRARLPAIMVELMVLIYRYIFLLLESLYTMTTAAHARLGYRTYRSSWRSFAGIGSNLLTRAFARAGRSFDAMEARGYDGEIRFLEGEKPVKGLHVALSAGVFMATALILILERGVL